MSKDMCIDFKLAARPILISHGTVCIASCVPSKYPDTTWTFLFKILTKRGTVSRDRELSE
jgi:hypothetical protein